jgi:hypothetical protein
MTRTRFFLVLAASLAGLATAAQPSPFDALRARFPHGIPWQVDIVDTHGKASGTLEMLIKTEKAESCLGGMSDGVRVEFTRKDALPPSLSVESYGVAKLEGDTIKIDLTGGMCDAYLILSGTLAADGSSSGGIRTFGKGGGHDVATYSAKVK